VPTIKKRSGLEEKFNKDKIKNSMMNAGISQATAQEISDIIDHHEGITSSEVRNRVIGGIKNREPMAAKRYESHPKKSHKT